MGRTKKIRTPEEEAAETARKRAIGNNIGAQVLEYMTENLNPIRLKIELEEERQQISRLKNLLADALEDNGNLTRKLEAKEATV